MSPGPLLLHSPLNTPSSDFCPSRLQLSTSCSPPSVLRSPRPLLPMIFLCSPDFTVKKVNWMYVIDHWDDISRHCSTKQAHVVTTSDIQLWHHRLGNADCNMIAALHIATTEMPQVKRIYVERCVDCLLGKIKWVSFPRKLSQRATQPLQIVHVDLYGPIPVMSVGGNRYAIICIDDYSLWRDVSILVKKSDATRAFMLFKVRADKSHLKSVYKFIIVLRDRGELTSNNFVQQLASERIELNLTAPYTAHRAIFRWSRLGSSSMMQMSL